MAGVSRERKTTKTEGFCKRVVGASVFICPLSPTINELVNFYRLIFVIKNNFVLEALKSYNIKRQLFGTVDEKK